MKENTFATDYNTAAHDMSRKHQFTLLLLVSGLIVLSIACGLVLFALKQNINLFYTPSELLQATPKPQQAIRLGGYVKQGSVHYDTTGTHVDFIVTDRQHECHVRFSGVLPNLFREGQTVVVTGHLTEPHYLTAQEVLAKHDEKYMPRALAKSLGAKYGS